MSIAGTTRLVTITDTPWTIALVRQRNLGLPDYFVVTYGSQATRHDTIEQAHRDMVSCLTHAMRADGRIELSE